MMLIIMVLTSCEGSAVEEPLKGKVNLVLSSDTEIEVKSMGDNISVNDFKFKFDGVGEYEYEHQEYYRYGEVQMPMEWYLGIYTLYAESCTPDEAEEGYGCVRYAGESAQFSVMNDYVETVSVLCKVANCRVNVKFDNSMYETFADFKLVVNSVPATVSEEDPSSSRIYRALEFNPIDKQGFYNLQDEPINLHYTLYVCLGSATEYLESVSGFFEEDGEPAVVEAADDITFNIVYTGDPIITPDIKFIVNGIRVYAQNGINLPAYERDEKLEGDN